MSASDDITWNIISEVFVQNGIRTRNEHMLRSKDVRSMQYFSFWTLWGVDTFLRLDIMKIPSYNNRILDNPNIVSSFKHFTFENLRHVIGYPILNLFTLTFKNILYS